MNIKITDKKGITLLTDNTICEEDIKIEIDESLLGESKPEQEKSVTPSKAQQDVEPDEGYTLSKVTVEAIPSEYVKPSGELEVTDNGTYDVTEKKSVNVNVEKGIYPTGTLIITENGEYDVIDKAYVEVNVAGSGGGAVDTVKLLFDAKKTMSAEFKSITSLTTQQLDEIFINPDATSNVTNLFECFYGCTNLTTIPLINTSKVTNMSYCFSGCTNLTTIPQLDTSDVTNMSYCFDGCTSLTTIPLINTSDVTNIRYCFNSCARLTTIPQLDTSRVDNMNGTFNNCASLTTIPQLDTSRVTNMGYCFRGCTNLTTIPQLDASKVTGMSYCFDGCTSLKSILMYGMKINFDISASVNFEREDLVTILNNLATVSSTKTLTMGETNLAKLTDDDKAIATNKGWTLA